MTHRMCGAAIALVLATWRLSACGSPPPPPPRALAAPAQTATGVDACAAARSAERAGAADSLEFRSAFWINLHHVLYAAAWAQRGPGARSQAGALPPPLTAALTPELAAGERAAWDRAVAYYDRALASQDLLFSDEMQAIAAALVAACPDRLPAGLAPEHAAVLAAAAPVYRAHGWAAHDRANRAWTADAIDRVRALSPAVPDRLARLYGTPWFTAPVRVDVVIVGKRQGAYTSLGPTHITISSSDRDDQQWAAAETVFHESSHALVAPVRAAFDREARAAGKQLPVLWHVALFALTGEVVRQALAARNIAYVPYVYALGLFDRAWPAMRAPLEAHWRPYVDGKASLDDAVRAVVAATPSEP